MLHDILYCLSIETHRFLRSVLIPIPECIQQNWSMYTSRYTTEAKSFSVFIFDFYLAIEIPKTETNRWIKRDTDKGRIYLFIDKMKRIEKIQI